MQNWQIPTSLKIDVYLCDTNQIMKITSKLIFKLVRVKMAFESYCDTNHESPVSNHQSQNK